MNSPLAEVVLVHGAWHGAWCFDALRAELDALGVSSVAIDLPGHGDSREPSTDLLGDAASVVAAVNARPGAVTLVGHSYGGAVITQAALDCPNVTHLVYLAAFVPDVGESVIGLTRSLPAAETMLSRAIVVGDGASTIDPDLARDTFYGCTDDATATAAIARLDAQPYATFRQGATQAAWRTIPSTYVRCTRDRAVPFVQQEVMAAHCGAIHTLDADHSPFTSMPTQTASIIAACAAMRPNNEEQ